MHRPSLRTLLIVCLILSAAFAAWTWLRPYEWNPDPQARAKIVSTLVTRDHGYFWVETHLKFRADQIHDLEQPVFLLTADGKKFAPADTTFSANPAKPGAEIWYKFWLEPAELSGPLTLHLNGGKLLVKSRAGVPELSHAQFRNFTSNHW